MLKLAAVVELSSTGRTIVGFVLLAAGILLLIFRKTYQAVYLSFSRGQPESRFTYVVKYIYAPALLALFGILLLLTGR